MRKTILLLAVALLLAGPPAARKGDPPELSAERAVLVGPEGQILMEKNARERCPIASTTKLMTALVVLDHAGLDETVEIPEDCCGIEGSSMYLRPGERYSVRELLEGLLLASGNDAAEALARCCAGDRETFLAWMNEKARELGMEDSHFANPHGLDEEGHYSTAEDLARLMLCALSRDDLAKLLGTRSAECRGEYYVNHNKLLWSCPGCLGGKTGYTQAAGRCLVSCCQREGTRLICVTLSAPDDWNDHRKLYDWGFARYVTGNVTKELRYTLPVYGGTSSAAELEAEPLSLFLPKDAVLELRTELPRFVLAPVRAGEIGGRVTLLLDGEEVGSAALRFRSPIPAQGNDKENDT